MIFLIPVNGAVIGVITLFVLGILAVSSASAENTQDKQCRDIHVLVERPSGSLACLTEKTAERAADRFGWKIIAENPAEKTMPDSENSMFHDEISIHDDVKINTTKESTDITQSYDDDIGTSLQEPLREHTNQQDMNDPCYDITENAEYPYVLVEPINHSITSGDFVKLCVQSPNKWFKIYLDADDEWLPPEITDDEINYPRNYLHTYAAGSITLEVPKDIVDQKHYDPDYLDCNDAYYQDGKYDYPQFTNYKVEHIAQTDKSRTLKFTYEMPVSEINYFGSFAIFDDYYYSRPNVCIKESAERSGEKITAKNTEQQTSSVSEHAEHQDTTSVQENVKINKESTGITKSQADDVSKTVTENIHLQEPPKQSTDADDPCHGAAEVAGHPYMLVEPITHSMTGGTFEKLCAQPHYKWFKIYLNTHAGGSITLEIPKSQVDLKQYDYRDCNDGGQYYLDGKYDGYTLKNFTVEHLAHTDKSRTLKFTYDKPVSVISYFGAYGVFDGADYSEPKSCINAYEQNNYDPTKRLPWNEPKPDPPPPPCQIFIGLNYTITSGQVDKICGDSWGEFVEFYLNNVTSNAELTVDIPLMQMRPYYTDILDNVVFDRNTDADDSGCQPPRELLFRNQEYQTFKIPILAGASYAYIGYVLYDYGSPRPLSEIIAAVEPFDRSKDDVTEKC